MITVWENDHQKIIRRQISPGQRLGPGAIWIDLLAPSGEELAFTQSLVGFHIPASPEKCEIEHSNRMRVEGGIFILSLPAVEMNGDGMQIGCDTFILSSKLLLTIRSIDSKAFSSFHEWIASQPASITTPEQMFLEINEALISHTADALETTEKRLETLTNSILAGGPTQRGRLKELGGMRYVMHTLGQIGNLVMKIRYGVEWFEIILNFLKGEAQYRFNSDEMKRIDIAIRDLRSLADHTNFIEQQATFVLDAALGMISIEQNESLRWFTVISTVFMPPTLIASMYGMNFKYMPEIRWPLGYPMALTLIIGSTIASALYFRRRGWI